VPILASVQGHRRSLKMAPSYGGILKSNVSDFLELAHSVYIDACAKCIADVSDLRDLQTVKSRVENEGLSFLTITLPQFCTDFERSLADGIIGSKLFLSFKKNRSIPAFLQGMVSQIFDYETGRIFDVNSKNWSKDSTTVIESIRQICLAFKKVEIACSPKRERAALDEYIKTEQSFDMFTLSEPDYAKFISVSGMLWDNLVSTIVLSECVPAHGPGITAEGISGNRKYHWRSWHDRLEPYFPLIDSGYPLGTPIDSEELKSVTIVPEEQEQPVKVVFVPKTLKSPRVIAIEPCCVQFAQQGIRSALYEAIESYWLTRGHVNFRDQSINQQLAITASSTGLLATIDLSDASDRVPHDLAMEMFRSNPDLQGAIEACRSTRALLPDGTLVAPLKKFASMGSALCFPVEAMYFYTLCVVALLEAQNLPVTSRNCFIVSRSVHVYGDDIIVPSTYAIAVLDYLQKYNCKVNANKTFVSGNFRESCGEDAYLGKSVKPTYFRKVFPKDRHQSDALISWVETANSFYLKGYWRTTSLIFEKLERVIGPLPYLPETSPGLGRISFLGYRYTERENVRWNGKLQRLEIKALVPSPVYRTDRLGGYGALMKIFLTSRGRDYNNLIPEATDVRHLEHSALHGAVSLKRRWVPAS